MALPMIWLASSQAVSRTSKSDSGKSEPAILLATRTAVSGSRSMMIRPSMSPVTHTMAATPFRRYASSSMLRLPMAVLHCNPCASTASAELMNGWINSIFMRSCPRAGRVHDRAVFTQNVLDDLVQDLGLHGLLDKVARAPLQCRHDVFLVAHRRHHDNARFRMRLHDPFGGFDAFHLRHGDIHEHDVRMRPVILGDGGQAIACLAGQMSTEGLDHAGQVLARKDRVVHDQIADRLPVLAAFYWRKLLHN